MKKYIALTASVMVSLCAAAQEAEENIVLPEITTTVSGDSLVAGKDAVPDFSQVLPPSSSAAPLPALPGVQTGQENEEPVADFSSYEEKQLYAQGLIGAGVPGYFTGDFSIYKTSGNEPFSLEFSHESRNGYGKHSAASGFYDSDTKLLGKKTFAWDKITLDFDGFYDTQKFGLQSQSDSFNDLTHQTVNGGTVFTWKLPHDFYAGAGVNLEWYNRYSGKNKNSSSSVLPQESETDVTFFSPRLFAGWKNDSFDVELSAAYSNETMWDGEKETVPAGSASSVEVPDSFSVNRFDAALNLNWSYSFFKLGLGGGVIAGNHIGDNSVLGHFDVRTDFTFELEDNIRPIVISAAGGLKSSSLRLSEAEKGSLFTSQLFLFEEVTDWYGYAALSIPLGTRFVLDADTTFRTTAFGNGVWETDYDECLESRLYTAVSAKDRSILTSNAKLSFAWKIFTVDISWKNNLLHVPSNEASNYAGLKISYQNEDAKWGFNASAFESIGDDVDFCPIVNGSIFYRLRDSIRLALEVEDAIKLVLRRDRDYGESVYIKKAGSAKVLVRFFF